MKQTLNLKLSQQLTLTPQLKQSLRLLQLSSLDLEIEIQQALDSNPLLERIESEAEVSLDDKKSLTESTSKSADDAPEQELSLEWQESIENQDNHFPAPTSSHEGIEFTQFVSKEETLFEHLYWQVQMTTLSDKDKLIARALLRSLNDDAYLNVELNEVCDMLDPELNTDVDEVAAILSLIKTLEPIGIGARNLGERLTMQLNNLDDNINAETLHNAKLIISDHLELLATRNTVKLKKALSLDDQTLSDSLSLITTLNPRITSQ